ncbi:heavy metal-associated isoprenylated plant protein 3 [Selaginella moellendorffii]|nr:heavy metal-associated isoprenylated plant protein 3 [Selaginella moellendorffii]|eukprot:XP_002973943.2 heavy metal-associated isoprenylated plant protein 3 [Selaginella moellendorffii]
MGSDGKGEKDDKKKEEKKPQTTVLKLQFHCDNCVKRVKKSVATLKGVTSITVDEKSGKVTVVGHVEPKKVLKRVQKTGKHVEMLEPKEKKDDKSKDEKSKKDKGDDSSSKKKDEGGSKKDDKKDGDGGKSSGKKDEHQLMITRIAHNDFTYVFSDDNPNNNCSIM